jgi:lipopolysaccharide heptosyltransferase I
VRRSKTVKVLIVRLGALGDVVHAIPVAAALRRAVPAARIDWLVSARHRAVLDLVPVIDRRLVLEAGARQGRTLLAAVRELRRARYDVTIDLQGLVKSALLARGSGASRVVGFATSYLRERLARPFYTDVYDPGCGGIYDPRETRHVVEINLGLLQPLGVFATVPEFPIDRVDSAVARLIGEQSGGRYALLNPGARWPNKRWPPARFGQLAAMLRERYGLTSIALWAGDERPLAEEIVAHAGGAALVSPPAAIADLVALARGAVVMVSGDTGPTHIAAAVGTPVVGIFGPTRPARNGPWSPDDVTVSRDGACQCHHLRRCRLQTMCLLDITVADMVGAVGRRLAAADRPLGRHV